MKRLEMKNIRNIGIMAHVDAGKTTLSEQILAKAGRIRAAGRIDDGNTTLDFSQEERDRGITIDSAATSLNWTTAGIRYHVNLVDTPGHVDFTIEVERALRVLDGAVAVFCAVGGVEPQSETVWRQADGYELPRIAYVNKMDLAGAEFDRVLEEMSERLGARPIAVQLPIGAGAEFEGVVDLLTMEVLRWIDGQVVREPTTIAEAVAAREALVESLAELDETLLEQFAAGSVETSAIRDALRGLTLIGHIVPVLCGSALAELGTEPLLDAVMQYLPSPADRPSLHGTDPAGGEAVVVTAGDGAFAGLVFKLVQDEFAGQLAFVRVYRGSLRRGDVVFDADRDVTLKVGRLSQVHADEREEVEELSAGMIGVVLGLRGVMPGATLCDATTTVRFAPIARPEPVVWMTIEPASSADRVALSEALSRLALDDPSLCLRFDSETGESLIGGQGELHLDVARTRLQSRHGVDARFGRPEVAYRETVAIEVVHRVRLKKQSGGPGMFAEVELRVSPAERGEGNSFTSSVVGGAVPREYVQAVEAGVADATTAGVLGHPVTDVRVELLDGATHSNDSSAMAFRLCAAQCLRDALALAKPTVLEPVMRLTITTPRDRMGDVIGEVERRRGSVDNIEAGQAAHRVTARTPLAELFGFANALRTLSSGRATHHLELAEYARSNR